MSHVVARVSARAIDGLSTAGSGDIRAASLTSKNLKVSIAGSGDVHIETLAANDLQVSIAGSGDVLVSGKVDGGAHLDRGLRRHESVEARVARVVVSPSRAPATPCSGCMTSIHVSIMGSGDVRYYGDPALNKSVLGSGSVKRVAASPS